MNRLVLIVDDSHSARLRLRSSFESAGYVVVEAMSGSEGLDYMKSSSERVDFIITDQNMPGLTGVEMMSEIRLLPDVEKSNVPFILLTSDVSPTLSDLASNLKVKAVVGKPARPDDLVLAVSKTLER